jgi:hypothetical protein
VPSFSTAEFIHKLNVVRTSAVSSDILAKKPEAFSGVEIMQGRAKGAAANTSFLNQLIKFQRRKQNLTKFNTA